MNSHLVCFTLIEVLSITQYSSYCNNIKCNCMLKSNQHRCVSYFSKHCTALLAFLTLISARFPGSLRY